MPGRAQPPPRHLTRIIATVGPASRDEEQIERLIRAGVDIFRLNFSHGDHEEHKRVCDRIRFQAESLGATVSVLQDIAGPKLRIGPIADDPIVLLSGGAFRLERNLEEGNAARAGIGEAPWLDSVEVGHRVLLGDGEVRLRVVAKNKRGLDCEVVSGGEVRGRQGMNFPDSALDLGAVTEKDWKDIDLGLQIGVDAIALSFVQGPEDLVAVRSYIRRMRRPPLLVAKIELPRAVQRIREILEVTDGLMVARGDLGLTMPIERIPVVQKRLIRLAREAGRFVITATQMLESMKTSAQPTRAEVTDVANAVYDGSDAVMLSGETAVGTHPALVVETMANILREAEPDANMPPLPLTDRTIDSAMARAAKDLVKELSARAVLVPVTNGTTAMRISRQRIGVPILAGTVDPCDARRINFYSSVFPVTAPHKAGLFNNLRRLVRRAEKRGWVEKGDAVIVSGGFPLEQTGVTNYVRAYVVGEPL